MTCCGAAIHRLLFSLNIDVLGLGRVIKSGPLLSPRERGPDLIPVPDTPEVGADIPTTICGCSVDAKRRIYSFLVKCCR